MDRLDIKMAIKMVVVVVLSIYLSNGLILFIQNPGYHLLTNLWCVVTAVIVLQANIGGTYQAIWLRLIGVCIGSAMGALFAFAFGAGMGSLASAIFMTIILCSFLKIQDSYRLSALCVVVIMLPWKANPESSLWGYAFLRFLDTCLGFIAALLVLHLLWPSRALSHMADKMRERFDLCRQFLDALFSEKGVSTEVLKDINEKMKESFNQSQVLLKEARAEFFMQSDELNCWINLMKCQEQLWENLLTLQMISYSLLEETFDESLRRYIQHVLMMIHLIMKEIEAKLQDKQSIINAYSIEDVQEGLTKELIRFRSTHRLQLYHVEIVEDCFVLFYELRQLLANLQKFSLMLGH